MTNTIDITKLKIGSFLLFHNKHKTPNVTELVKIDFLPSKHIFPVTTFGGTRPFIATRRHLSYVTLNDNYMKILLPLFGFEVGNGKASIRIGVHILSIYKNKNNTYSAFYKQDIGQGNHENMFLREVKYLHELQSIYFSLTGRELIDNLKSDDDENN